MIDRAESDVRLAACPLSANSGHRTVIKKPRLYLPGGLASQMPGVDSLNTHQKKREPSYGDNQAPRDHAACVTEA
jgi:hypothetical protein